MAYPIESNLTVGSEASNEPSCAATLSTLSNVSGVASAKDVTADMHANTSRGSKGSGNSLSALSRIALKETMTELSISAQQTRAVSSATLQRLRLEAEKRLGIDVQLEDPAMDELFGYLLQVENSLEELRCHTNSLLEGTRVLCDGLHSSYSSSFQNLIGKVAAGTSNTKESSTNHRSALAESFAVLAAKSRIYERVPEMVSDSIRNTLSLSPNAGGVGSARYQMMRRLQEEVLDAIESQFAEHDRLRELIRERQVCGKKVEQCQRQVATLRKHENGGSGLRPLATIWTSPGCATGAEERLRHTQSKIASLDGDVFAKLLEIKAHAHGLVARPWAAFAQIRADYFASLAGHWAPVATSLCDPETGRRKSTQSSTCNSPRRHGSSTSVDDSSPTVAARTVVSVDRVDEEGSVGIAPLEDRLLDDVNTPLEAEDSNCAPTFTGDISVAPISPSSTSLECAETIEIDA